MNDSEYKTKLRLTIQLKTNKQAKYKRKAFENSLIEVLSLT